MSEIKNSNKSFDHIQHQFSDHYKFQSTKGKLRVKILILLLLFLYLGRREHCDLNDFWCKFNFNSYLFFIAVLVFLTHITKQCFPPELYRLIWVFYIAFKWQKIMYNCVIADMCLYLNSNSNRLVQLVNQMIHEFLFWTCCKSGPCNLMENQHLLL